MDSFTGDSKHGRGSGKLLSSIPAAESTMNTAWQPTTALGSARQAVLRTKKPQNSPHFEPCARAQCCKSRQEQQHQKLQCKSTKNIWFLPKHVLDELTTVKFETDRQMPKLKQQRQLTPWFSFTALSTLESVLLIKECRTGLWGFFQKCD